MIQVNAKIEFDTNKWRQIVVKHAKEILWKAAQRLIEIMEKESQMTVYGNSPGRTEWRRKMASDMTKVYEKIGNDMVEFGIGLSYHEDSLDYMKAMIVTEGSGFWVGNDPIHAGPAGRLVWDKEFNRKPSKVQKEYDLPDAFNQPGNDWLETSMEIFRREFGRYLTMVWEDIPDAEFQSCFRMTQRKG